MQSRPSHRTSLNAIGLLLLAVLTSSLLARAQQFLASITGNVTDQSGALIPNAIVTFTNVETNTPTIAKANEAGVYNIPFITPGTYTAKVDAAGFATLEQKNVVLTASDKRILDVRLQPGAATETVTVSSEPQVLDTGSANLGQTLEAAAVTDLPNIGRNPFILATLSAGVFSGTYATTKASQFTQPYSGVAVQVTANGIGGHDKLTLDGIADDAPERLSGVNYTGFVPSPEAVQEVKTQTALYDAQYGHSDGLLINTVLRNGENRYHGSAYYIFQNTYLDANLYERSRAGLPRPNNQFNQPGGVIDGPVIIPHLYDGRDKTFFMVAYERIQNNSPQTLTALVPSLAQRNGDFTGGRAIYDPLTTTAAGTRSQFANNVILPGRIDPVAKALLAYIPLPNASGPNYNFVASSNTTSHDAYNSLAIRGDQALGQKNKLILTYFRSRRNQTPSQQGFPSLIGSPASKVNRDNNGGSIDVVSSISPSISLDSRIGVQNHPFGLFPYGYNFNLASLGFPASVTGNIPVQTFPGTTFSDSYLGLTAAVAQFSNSAYLNYSELLSKTFSQHAVRVGFEYQVLRYNVATPNVSNLGSFAFSRRFTEQKANSSDNTGDPVAAFLLGYADSGTEQTTTQLALQQLYFAGFVQDDWRATPKLTLNLGIRYDIEQPITDRSNRFNAGFCSTCLNPIQVPGLAPLLGGLQFTSASNRKPYNADYNNLQPRFGLAYQVNPGTVLRAGFGMTYFQTVDPGSTNGFSTTTSYISSNDGNLTPANVLSNPYPNGFNLPAGSAQGLATLAGTSLTVSTVDHRIPKVYQYSVNVQSQIPGGFVFEIGFVGTNARQLPLTRNLNYLPANLLSTPATYNSATYAQQNAYLQQTVPNPLYGVLPKSSNQGASPTITRGALLTPYPLFSSVNISNLPIGTLDYAAMQDRLTRRFANGLTLLANFTWAKIMDRNTVINAADLTLPRYEDTQPNLYFTLAASYRFPTPFKSNRLARELLGGWEVNTVVRAQNGSLLTEPGGVTQIGNARIGNQTHAQVFNTCYADVNGSPVASTATNTACSGAAQPAFRVVPGSNFLNNTSTALPISGVRIALAPLTDLSLFKKFQVYESATFEIRGEFFNVMNSANFGGPNESVGNALFGSTVLTQANDPRIGQLTARFNF